MQRKFEVYRDAGVREYWVLNSKHKTLMVYLFEGNREDPSEQVIARSYGEKDTAPVTVLNGLSIELGPVFAE
jgi:Uma2 family endonuclease